MCKLSFSCSRTISLTSQLLTLPQEMTTALEQEHCTATQSLSLVKNMLRISVSSICYHRELFSKECFVTEKADKGKKNFIHILSSADHEYDDQGMVISAQIRDAGAFLLTQWLEVSCE